MTETLIQIWLWCKLIGIFFGACTLLILGIMALATMRPDYSPITINGKDYLFKTWDRNSATRTVRIVHKGFFKRNASQSFLVGTLTRTSAAIKALNKKGEVPWK